MRECRGVRGEVARMIENNRELASKREARMGKTGHSMDYS
eukprot:COSAG02_NODE_224_length_28285_cov_39.533066_14_plen_40_part_00